MDDFLSMHIMVHVFIIFKAVLREKWPCHKMWGNLPVDRYVIARCRCNSNSIEDETHFWKKNDYQGK